VPLDSESAAHHAHHAGMHYQGMWVALGVAASFIVYFLSRATRELAERERELERVREWTARHERLASLATLAAGAAHELATPLSTIAVAGKELERMLSQSSEELGLADVRLIREQVARCREILGQLATDAGQAAADSVTALDVADLVERALSGLPGRAQVRVRVAGSADLEPIVGPARALVEAIRNLLKNALEASSDAGPVDLVIDRSQVGWSISVSDRGAGMSADVSARAVEPFFTTKAAGSGMGLGLFLCKSVADQLGGSLDLRSAPGQGTEAVLRFPPPRREQERAT
jgi:two-component system sensor histidine kinase RegB